MTRITAASQRSEAAGDKYLASDAVFGVKPSLVVKPARQDGGLTLTYGFGLARS
jgi:catechol 1,2-dioxygenase